MIGRQNDTMWGTCILSPVEYAHCPRDPKEQMISIIQVRRSFVAVIMTNKILHLESQERSVVSDRTTSYWLAKKGAGCSRHAVFVLESVYHYGFPLNLTWTPQLSFPTTFLLLMLPLLKNFPVFNTTNVDRSRSSFIHLSLKWSL